MYVCICMSACVCVAFMRIHVCESVNNMGKGIGRAGGGGRAHKPSGTLCEQLVRS